jgi:hypothetical protein
LSSEKVQSLNVHAGSVRFSKIPCKFPANSLLLNEIWRFWAEFDDFTAHSKKFPANFPAIGKMDFKTLATAEWRSIIAENRLGPQKCARTRKEK